MAKKIPADSMLAGGLSSAAVQGMKETVAKKRGAPLPKGKSAPRPLKDGAVGERFLKQSEQAAKEAAKTEKFRQAYSPPKKILKWPDTGKHPSFQAEGVQVILYKGAGAMTVEEAMEEIGWEIVEDGPFHLKDIHGAKVRLSKMPTQRPFRLGLANRYKSEFLRNKWKFNGETLIFDWFDNGQSCQHRLAGFILAEEERREDRPVPGRQGVGWKEACKVHWGRGGPLTFECIVVKGIDPSPEVVDTMDQGLRRTMGDVFFREERFASGLLPGQSAPVSVGKGKKEGNGQLTAPPMPELVRRKLCTILAHATRLVWLRAGGKKVSDAPHFPLSEAVDFVNEHPKLEECVLYIWGLEGGSGKGGQKITQFIGSLGYAAGLMYLMMASSTDPDEWMESGAAALDFKLEKKAKEFWAKFASGANLGEKDPIHIARELVRSIDAGSGVGRDEVVGTVINAFNLWVDGKEAAIKDVGMKKYQDDFGKWKLSTEPRLGGIDTEGPEKPEHLDVQKVEDTREGSMSDKKGKNWSEGDTCWVRCDDGEHWFGTIKEIVKTVDGKEAVVEDADTGREWSEPLKNLWLKYPGVS